MQRILIAILALMLLVPARADEGMWLLPLIAKYNIGTMKKLGCKLSAEDIYSVNKASLKDAVVIFGRGCTGEVVSDKGLVFTNHHCGYSEIQSVTTLEHNYLRDGYFAHSMDEEIPIPGLKVQFLKSITDITEEYLAAEAINAVDSLYEKYESQSDEEKGKSVVVESYFDGNQYFVLEYEVYSDIRLVATPSDALGKFGGDTDNWCWPRHTCDFSVFRIYADKDGRPAQYSAQNVPFKPKKFLEISLAGYKEGDFAMTIGFPGSTNRYNSSYRIKSVMETTNAPRVEVREAKQEIWLKAMLANEQTRINYSSKYATSSNYWKNAIGQNRCINRIGVIANREAQEAQFNQWAANGEYKNLLADQKKFFEDNYSVLKDFTYYSETFLRGIEAFGKAREYIRLTSKEFTFEEEVKLLEEYFRDYEVDLDKKVAVELLKLYREKLTNKKYLPKFYGVIDTVYNGDYQRFIDDTYANSIFASKELKDRFVKYISSGDTTQFDLSEQMLRSDSIFSYVFYERTNELMYDFFDAIDVRDSLQRAYTRATMEWKKGQNLYPGANFTMRMSYGTVRRYKPADAVEYSYFTTSKGYLEKIAETTNPDYDKDAGFVAALGKGDFGPYADKKDKLLHTCFITTNDITGGNSGSPVINGKGQLIGLAFDGNWESMASDFQFDDDLTRCVNVDIRYVLYVIDRVGGAKNIINELKISK